MPSRQILPILVLSIRIIMTPRSLAAENVLAATSSRVCRSAASTPSTVGYVFSTDCHGTPPSTRAPDTPSKLSAFDLHTSLGLIAEELLSSVHDVRTRPRHGRQGWNDVMAGATTSRSRWDVLRAGTAARHDAGDGLIVRGESDARAPHSVMA